ncbi:MAG: very short patch repair endonuclease [Methylococcales bacterium]
MVDVVTPHQRSRMMAGIRGKNTKPEMLVRRSLFAKGLRYRLHRRDLPGMPDIVLVGRRVAIFVHGCFWHQHQGCKYVKQPDSNKLFWENKLGGNLERDQMNMSQLLEAGWRVLVVWECFTRSNQDINKLGQELTFWIQGIEYFGEFPSSHYPKLSDNESIG